MEAVSGVERRLTGSSDGERFRTARPESLTASGYAVSRPDGVVSRRCAWCGRAAVEPDWAVRRSFKLSVEERVICLESGLDGENLHMRY